MWQPINVAPEAFVFQRATGGILDAPCPWTEGPDKTECVKHAPTSNEQILGILVFGRVL